jgi:hypothetical protein
LEIHDTAGIDIDWDLLGHLDLSSLSDISLVSLLDVPAVRFLDLAMKSECKEITLHSTMNLTLPSSAFFAHELMRRVVDVEFEFGKKILLFSLEVLVLNLSFRLRWYLL